MTRPLSVLDVATLLKRSPQTRDAILVGGQALNVWAAFLGLRTEAAALSHDIDFFGNRAVALAAGHDWNAKHISVAQFDDHTPNAAVVDIEIDGQRHSIDFMSSVAGVDSRELQDRKVEIRSPDYRFHVMHPLHVLQSQIENVYGLLKRRDDPDGKYYAGRVALALDVARESVRALLDAASTRDASKFAEQIGKLALTSAGMESWRRDGVELLDAIPADKRWPRSFSKTRLPQLRAYVQEKRDKRSRRAGQPKK